MQTLQNFLSESLVVEATQAAETIEIKNGKNFIDNKTKAITLTGNVKYAEVYFDKNLAVESIDLTGVHADDLRLDVVGCNKVQTITGGTGERIHAVIRKNAKLEKVSLSGYNSFGNQADGVAQMTYIDSNKSLKLTDADLPKMVDDKHGLDINNGVKHSRSNGMEGKNKLSEN